MLKGISSLPGAGSWKLVAGLGTLSSELGPFVAGIAGGAPRIYADANLPNGVVAFMRATLGWDVLYVIEHDDLRRARDIEHYRLARQLGRTLVTLDRDYLDDRIFPPADGAGVIVLAAPDERWLRRLLAEAHRQFFNGAVLPFEGRKLTWNIGALDLPADERAGA